MPPGTGPFASDDPVEVNRTLQVTGGYEHLVNNLVELLRAGARLAGLVGGRRPRTEDCLQAIHGDGGLTNTQVDLLARLYLVRGRLGHASPDVTADEVRAHVLLLVEHLPGLTRSAIDWLKRSGIDLERVRPRS